MMTIASTMHYLKKKSKKNTHFGLHGRSSFTPLLNIIAKYVIKTFKAVRATHCLLWRIFIVIATHSAVCGPAGIVTKSK